MLNVDFTTKYGDEEHHLIDVCSKHFWPYLNEICRLQGIDKSTLCDFDGVYPVEVSEETYLALMYKHDEKTGFTPLFYLYEELFIAAYDMRLPVIMRASW